MNGKKEVKIYTNYELIKKGLHDFPSAEITRYVNYLKKVETELDRDKKPKNWWFPKIDAQTFIDIYTKVSIDNLSIDGETVTIQYRNGLLISFNYQAYKNRVLNVYPETKFDIQLVNDGDEFSFRKESGTVIYSHKIVDPFKDKNEVIGAYCIIKNSRGEFLETLNLAEIKLMKSASKMQNIWNDWFGEMVLKSVIKRACKRHFRDITKSIDSIDNETYDLKNVGFDELISEKVAGAKTLNELKVIYFSEKNNVTDEVQFIHILSERKKELMERLPEITESDFIEAVEMLQAGKNKNDLLLIWKIDQETMETLISSAL